MPRLIAALTLSILLLSSGAWGAPAPDSSKRINGSVFGFTEGVDEALENARIELRPVAPIKGRDRRPATDLLGLALSDAQGNFVINELSSASKRKAYPLMPNWTYEAKVIAPGHYVFHGVVTWYGEGEPWDFMLEGKVTDVVDDSGTITKEERQLQRGATRRGDQ